MIDGPSDIAARVNAAIRQAAGVTGAGFDYLLKTALRESNLNPTVRAPTSSAAGLFQFLDQTWLAMLKREGTAHGYGRYADAIVQTGPGQYAVPDPVMRKQVMDLRTDPAANALMAGAFTQYNTAELTRELGRKPSDGELYIAHVLGPAGAVKLISLAATQPQADAAAAFPSAARANRALFFDAQGRGRSAGELYRVLTSWHENAPIRAEPKLATVPLQIAPAQARDPSAEPPARAPVTGPIFHSLFRPDQGSPVAPVVSALWGSQAAVPPSPPVAAQRAPAAPPANPAGAKAPSPLFHDLVRSGGPDEPQR